jgi:hypothetical protein
MQFTRCVQISVLAYFATVVNYARKMLKTLSPALNFPCFCETFVDEMFLTQPYLFFSSKTTTILFWSTMGKVWVCHILSFSLPLSLFLSVTLSVCLSVCLSLSLSLSLSNSASIYSYVSIYLPIFLTLIFHCFSHFLSLSL